MWDTAGLLNQLSQHNTLKIALSAAHANVPYPQDLNKKVRYPHRVDAYLFIFMRAGWSTHRVDLEEVTLKKGEVLFLTPHQIHSIPSGWANVEECYKLALDDTALSLLPQSFDFLLNPVNNPLISLADRQQGRIAACVDALAQILPGKEDDTNSLLLAHLNTLLTELNYSYFKCSHGRLNAAESLPVFINFKRIVNETFRRQPTVRLISAELSISENKLYETVKKITGFSPKEYLLRRTILEAQRILFYDYSTVKELAYDLGFADPDYFSRLFKKYTGKTVSLFLKEAAGFQNKHR